MGVLIWAVQTRRTLVSKTQDFVQRAEAPPPREQEAPPMRPLNWLVNAVLHPENRIKLDSGNCDHCCWAAMHSSLH